MPICVKRKDFKCAGLLNDSSFNNALFIFDFPNPVCVCVKSMHHLTKATVAMLQLITCSVTEFWCRKRNQFKNQTRHNANKEHSLGRRYANITDGNQSRLFFDYHINGRSVFSRSTVNPHFKSPAEMTCSYRKKKNLHPWAVQRVLTGRQHALPRLTL